MPTTSASWSYAFVRGNRSEVPEDLPHEMRGYMQINLLARIIQPTWPAGEQRGPSLRLAAVKSADTHRRLFREPGASPGFTSRRHQEPEA